MSRGDCVRFNGERLLVQRAKLHALITPRARVRRAAREVFADEVLNDLLLEPLHVIDNVVRNAQFVGDPARILCGIQCATGFVRHLTAFAGRNAHGHAHDVVALLDEQGRGDRAVHSAGHRDKHAALGL